VRLDSRNAPHDGSNVALDLGEVVFDLGEVARQDVYFDLEVIEADADDDETIVDSVEASGEDAVALRDHMDLGLEILQESSEVSLVFRGHEKLRCCANRTTASSAIIEPNGAVMIVARSSDVGRDSGAS